MEKKDKKFNRKIFLLITIAVVVILAGLLICTHFYIEGSIFKSNNKTEDLKVEEEFNVNKDEEENKEEEQQDGEESKQEESIKIKMEINDENRIVLAEDVINVGKKGSYFGCSGGANDISDYNFDIEVNGKNHNIKHTKEYILIDDVISISNWESSHIQKMYIYKNYIIFNLNSGCHYTNYDIVNLENGKVKKDVEVISFKDIDNGIIKTGSADVIDNSNTDNKYLVNNKIIDLNNENDIVETIKDSKEMLCSEAYEILEDFENENYENYKLWEDSENYNYLTDHMECGNYCNEYKKSINFSGQCE